MPPEMKHYLTLNEQEIDGQCSEDRKARAVAACTLSPKQTLIIHDVYYVKLFLNRVNTLFIIHSLSMVEI